MDTMPKRRRSTDNPYILSKDEKNNIYLVSFVDGTNTYRTVKITREIYEAMDSFERRDLKEMNEFDRHGEHCEVYENTLNIRNAEKDISLEDSIIYKSTLDELKKAINQLPELQKRRIKMYYFEDLNVYDIARIERISHQVIDKNIKKAIRNLQKILKNLK